MGQVKSTKTHTHPPNSLPTQPEKKIHAHFSNHFLRLPEPEAIHPADLAWHQCIVSPHVQVSTLPKIITARIRSGNSDS